jgi:hypothetical protein
MRARAAAGVFVAFMAMNAAAASRAQPSAAAGVRQLDCRFPVSATGTWDRTGPRGVVEHGDVLELRIAAIDTVRGSAEFRYGAIVAPTVALVAGSTLHFIEPPVNGAMALVSVTLLPDATRVQAAYTRTEYYAYSGPGFTSIPRAQQYYGSCTPLFR